MKINDEKIKYELVIFPTIIPEANNNVGIANGGLSVISRFFTNPYDYLDDYIFQLSRIRLIFAPI